MGEIGSTSVGEDATDSKSLTDEPVLATPAVVDPLPVSTKHSEKLSEKPSSTIALLRRLFLGGLATKLTAVAIVLLGLGLMAGTAYFCWIIWLPRLWVWAGNSLVLLTPAILGSLLLIASPIYVWLAFESLSEPFSDIKINPVKETKVDLQAIETSTIDKLGDSDVGELLTLVRYSRAQLDAYYAMGLQQTRGSFRHALIAMWLGFLILLFGVFVHIVPVNVEGLSAPTGDFNIVVLASAAIIEVIAALFLWTYRSTVSQLTFYYQLQMRSHAVIQSFSIASTMTDPDASKGKVIEHALAAAIMPERLDLPSSKGLVSLARQP